MKNSVLAAALMLLCISARAQMTPEAVMGMTPDLPAAAALLDYYDQTCKPYGNGVSGPDVISQFLEAWNAAGEQISQMRGKTLTPAMRQDILKSKATSTGQSVQEAAGMSEAEARKLAQGTMDSRLAGLGLSQADLARMQSGNLSEAEQKALANKVMAARTGGMTSNANQAQAQLISEMVSLDQEAYRLQTEAIGKKESARKEGLALFDRKYRKTVEDLNQRIGKAAVALEDAVTEAQSKAADAQMRELQELRHKTLCKFYGEYIPLYRDAVVASMDICRARMLPVLKQKQAIQEQLHTLTGGAEYALSESVPFLASDLYYELSKDIVDFELELNI